LRISENRRKNECQSGEDSEKRQHLCGILASWNGWTRGPLTP